MDGERLRMILPYAACKRDIKSAGISRAEPHIVKQRGTGGQDMLSTDKLKNKEVINISDGRSLGFVSDIEVNLEKGAIEGIIIPAERGLFSWFHKGEEDRMIRWENVRTVGDDVILVETEPLLL